MKKILILLLISLVSAPLSHLHGQDTLITTKGKYVLKDAFFTPDSSFMFSASIVKVLDSARTDTVDNCKQVVGWDNVKFSKVLNADPDFVNYSVATDNPAATVQYSSDNVIWQDSNVLKLKNSTNCEAIFFRLKGCDLPSTWGCVIPFTARPFDGAQGDTIRDPQGDKAVKIVKRLVFDRFSDKNSRLGAADINLTVGKSKARYFLGAKGWRHVLAAPESGLTGYDYNPMVMEQGGQAWEFGEWVQTDVYASGKRAVGPDYEVDTQTRLFEFDLKFPEFKLPAAKITVMDAETERPTDPMLKRGVSYAKNTISLGSRVYFLGDDWLHRIGCPPAYSTSPKDFQEWLRNTSEATILNSFKDRVRNYTGYGYIMLNWEAVMFHVPDDQRYKLVAPLKWYSQQNYNAKLAAWMQTAFGMSRASFEGDFSLNLYAGIPDFVGTEAEFRTKYKRFGGQPDYARYLDVLLIGGYQNFPTNDGIIHHYVLEYLANKKFYPSKLAIASIWHNQEFLSGWKLAPVTPAGANYVFYNKPAAFNQTMYNWGVWTVAFGDGYHLWSDPVKWTDDWRDGVHGAKLFDGREAPQAPGKMFARNNLKNIDWLQRGVWDVSQHRDIIDAPTKWICDDPAVSYAKKSVLTAYKLSADGSEALVLALDMFRGEGLNESVLPAAVFGNRNITTHGTFTTVQRVKL